MTLHIGFDFDGVLADDSGEIVNTKEGYLAFHEHELERKDQIIGDGPLIGLFRKLMVAKRLAPHDLKISIITSRSFLTSKRVLDKLSFFDHEQLLDNVIFTAGGSKKAIIEALELDLFFDDKKCHVENLTNTIGVHVLYGISNAKPSS